MQVHHRTEVEKTEARSLTFSTASPRRRMETLSLFATPDQAADRWMFVKGLGLNYLGSKLALQSNMVLRMVASGRLGYMTARKRLSFCGRLVRFTTCQRLTSQTKHKAPSRHIQRRVMSRFEFGLSSPQWLAQTSTRPIIKSCLTFMPCFPVCGQLHSSNH